MTINAHPELPEFDYIRPDSLGDASRFLVDHAGDSRILLGGTDIFVRLRDGVWHEKLLVDIKHLEPVRDINFDPAAGLRIGAAANMNQVVASDVVQANYPLLASACRSVASYQLRSRATIAGNICNASPAGDTIGACQVLGARLEVYNAGHNGSSSAQNPGYRQQTLVNFFKGPGKTVLQAGDIVTAVLLPPPPAVSAGRYIKLGRNKWSDLSIVGVTVYAVPEANFASGYRFSIALASVAPVPLRPVAAEEFLASRLPGSETFRHAALLAQEASSPIDDVRGSARYRREMIAKLVLRGLQEVWSELAGGSALSGGN